MKSIRAYFMAKFYDASMRKTEALCLGKWRADLLEQVAGDVLEIGAGTGVNLPYYPDTVTSLVLSEPDPDMRGQLERRVKESGRAHVRVSTAGAERLDLPDQSFDSIVSTLVLCSVNDQPGSLREIHRLLRPGGSLFFIEHVVAKHDPSLVKWQRFFEPFWIFFCGNCHLTMDTERTIEEAGMSIDKIARTSLSGAPPVVRPAIRGVAVKPLA